MQRRNSRAVVLMEELGLHNSIADDMKQYLGTVRTQANSYKRELRSLQSKRQKDAITNS